jgi:4-amino-4-deoxy-L-arabinose transferase-like glycosyltransferase
LKNCIEEGNAILRSTDSAHLNLTLARMGNLLFLFLAARIVYLWSCRWFTRRTGLLALMILFNLPPVIGHGSLAALDVPGAAGLLTASYAILRWMEMPSTGGWIRMSLGILLAILTKFSNIAFLPLTILAIFVVYFMGGRAALQELCRGGKIRLRQSIASLFLVFLLIPVCYHFSSAVVSTSSSGKTMDTRSMRSTRGQCRGSIYPMYAFF